MAGRLNRGEVHLYDFDAPDKTRPVVILTRDNIIPLLSHVTIAPITSTIRGAVSEVLLTEEDGMKRPCAVNLHHTITVSQSKIGRRLGQLSTERMEQICRALRFSLGCDY